jgi:hypothetical protein
MHPSRVSYPIAALIAASLLPLSAAELKIDHATVAGARLDTMRQAFSTATGIQAEYGGPHSNRATEMALASFPDGSYIELMGAQPAHDPAALAAHTWSRFLRYNGGPCAFALRVPDVTAEANRLKAAGISVGTPERSGRSRPDGVALSWETADVGPGPRGSLFPFLIRDFTPRENRVNPQGKPTTTRFSGVARVVIGVSDLEGAVAQYRRAFGLPEPRRDRDNEFGAELAWFEGAPVVLAKGMASDSWLARRVDQFCDAPCAFVLGATSGPMDGRQSDWFGHTIIWANESRLGWRLGMETGH